MFILLVLVAMVVIMVIFWAATFALVSPPTVPHGIILIDSRNNGIVGRHRLCRKAGGTPHSENGV